MSTKKSIGLSIRKHRIVKELSQHKLAKLADVAHTRVSELELGKSNITLGRLLHICDVLKLDIKFVPADPLAKAKLAQDYENL